MYSGKPFNTLHVLYRNCTHTAEGEEEHLFCHMSSLQMNIESDHIDNRRSELTVPDLSSACTTHSGSKLSGSFLYWISLFSCLFSQTAILIATPIAAAPQNLNCLVSWFWLLRLWVLLSLRNPLKLGFPSIPHDQAAALTWVKYRSVKEKTPPEYIQLILLDL